METALELTFVDKTAQKRGAEVRNKQNKKKKKVAEESHENFRGFKRRRKKLQLLLVTFLEHTHAHIYIYKSDGWPYRSQEDVRFQEDKVKLWQAEKEDEVKLQQHH